MEKDRCGVSHFVLKKSGGVNNHGVKGRERFVYSGMARPSALVKTTMDESIILALITLETGRKDGVCTRPGMVNNG